MAATSTRSSPSCWARTTIRPYSRAMSATTQGARPTRITRDCRRASRRRRGARLATPCSPTAEGAAMPTHAFRIVNVFAESTLAGNPLAVLDDARAPRRRDDARRSRCSSTCPRRRSSCRPRRRPRACASSRRRSRCPFAGHPTLGTAHVARDVKRAGDRVTTLEMKAGVIPVEANGDAWTLEANAPAPCAGGVECRPRRDARARARRRPRRAALGRHRARTSS